MLVCKEVVRIIYEKVHVTKYLTLENIILKASASLWTVSEASLHKALCITNSVAIAQQPVIVCLRRP